MKILNAWKIATVFLGVCCALLVFRVIDQGITLTYLEASHDDSVRHIGLLAGLIEHEWLGLSVSEVRSNLAEYVISLPKNSVLLESNVDEDTIYLNGIAFKFRNEKLLSVN